MIPDLDWHPVVRLPEQYDVLDFTVGPEHRPPRTSPFSVGRYDEVRPTLYDQPMFGGERVLHVGVDLGGPAATDVFAFWGGTIASVADLDRSGDYGPTIVTAHSMDGRTLYALHGHLARRSLNAWKVGDAFERGATLAQLGAESENGGWPPHLHFQLSWDPPVGGDIAGVVRLDERQEALRRCPDPRIILGALY
jgi:peptidoglycan LD-endopeptidase LytH